MSVSLQHLTMLPSSMMNATMSPDSRRLLASGQHWTSSPPCRLGRNNTRSQVGAVAVSPLEEDFAMCIMQPAMQRHTGIPWSQQELAIASRAVVLVALGASTQHRHPAHRISRARAEHSGGDNGCAASKNGQYTLTP